jgi:hypothetical protein
MIDRLRFARDLVTDLRPHVQLVAENALLRQQLIVAERKIVGRPRWKPWERYATALATRFAPAWRTVTMLVQPATVLRYPDLLRTARRNQTPSRAILPEIVERI